MRCKVGDLAIIIRSTCGNEGREVTVVRSITPPWHPKFGPGWEVASVRPLNQRQPGLPFDAFPDSWLLPIHPFSDPEEITTDAPVDVEVLTS